MDEAYFTDNLQQLSEKAFYNRPDRREEYLKRADMLSGKIEGKEATLRFATMPGLGLSFRSNRKWGKPYVDVNFALRASHLIAESVFGPKSHPKLQEELKSIQREYENKLKQVEVSFYNSIIESVEKKYEMENRKQKNGFFQTIKNGFLTGLAMKHGFQAKRKLEKYKEQKHLKEVLKEYKRTVDRIVLPYRYWYHYGIPRLQLDVIDKELLSVGEASENLQIEESVIRDLIARNKISCFYVKNEEFVSKSELAQHFSN